MTREEWLNLKVGDIIYNIKSGKKRTIMRTYDTGLTKCVFLESGALYCGGERHLFNIKKIKTNKIMKCPKCNQTELIQLTN